MLKGKKGSIQDIALVAVILLVFGIFVLFGFKITSEINTQVQGMSVMPTEAKEASTTLTGHYPGIMDNMFLVLTIGLAIGAFILAAMVRVHPIFIPIYIIILVLVIFFSGVFSNIYQEMAATSALLTEANQLIFVSHILTYLPFIVGIFGTILMIVMYKLWQNSQ